MRHALSFFTLCALVGVLSLVGCSKEKSAEVGKCNLCGMDTTASKGRFVIDFENGKRVLACSGHCAVSLASKEVSKVFKATVYAYDTGQMVNARQAVYVLDSNLVPEGSMPPSVVALSSQDAADKFIAAHGGHKKGFVELMTVEAPKVEDQGGAPK